VPNYYKRQTLVDTWNHTLDGYFVHGSFTEDPKGNAVYISDPDPEKCQGV
jgi:hypothetical protein